MISLNDILKGFTNATIFPIVNDFCMDHGLCLNEHIVNSETRCIFVEFNYSNLLFCDGYNNGDGHGYGDGLGDGCGDGCGHGFFDGDGTGFGLGSGTRDGDGWGDSIEGQDGDGGDMND